MNRLPIVAILLGVLLTASFASAQSARVRVLDSANSDVVLISDAPASSIENITFDNVAIGGKPLRPGDARIKTNAWVKGINVR